MREIKASEAVLPVARSRVAQAKTLEESYPQGVKSAEGLVEELESEVEVANRNARHWVEKTPDVEAARAEMERALKKDIEEKLG